MAVPAGPGPRRAGMAPEWRRNGTAANSLFPRVPVFARFPPPVKKARGGMAERLKALPC